MVFRAPRSHPENYVIVLAPLFFVLFLILPPLVANKGERSAWRRPWAIGLVITCWMIIGTLWVEGERSPWSPDFSVQALPSYVVHASSGPIYKGTQLFHSKGCEYCHDIAGYGGHRGPDLTSIGDRLSADQLTIRVVKGGTNMPAYGVNLSANELSDIVTFLGSRKSP